MGTNSFLSPFRESLNLISIMIAGISLTLAGVAFRFSAVFRRKAVFGCMFVAASNA